MINIYYKYKIKILWIMTTYHKILSQFQKLGYYEESSLQEFDINRALDTICSKNTGFSQFERDIAEELWEHSSKDSSRTVQLRNYINTIIQAQNILREQIQITEQNLRRQTQPSQKQQYKEQLANLAKDHRLITSPFGLPPMKQAQTYLETSVGNNPMRKSQKMEESGIFGYQSNDREQSSKDLQAGFYIALFVLAWQIVLIFHKHHFFNLLVLFGVLSIYFLNYFDRNYMKFLLIILGVSIILDLLWLIVLAGHYWTLYPQTQHSTLHSGFLGFIVVMTCILMILKGVLLGIYYKYRENKENIIKVVRLPGNKFRLDGKQTYNMFTPLLAGIFSNSQY